MPGRRRAPTIILPISNELLERSIQLLLFTTKLTVWDAQSIRDILIRSNIAMEHGEDSYRNGLIKIALGIFNKVVEDRTIDGKILRDTVVGTCPNADEILETLKTEITSTGLILNEDTAEYIVQSFSDLSESQVLYGSVNPLVSLVEELQNLDAHNARALPKKFRDIVLPLISSMNRAEIERDDSDEMIFGEESFIRGQQRSIDEAKSPKSVVRTGCRELNMLLGGGFRAGRVYVFLGAPGTGKSLMLENVLYWACSMNRYDPSTLKEGMKPIVLYVTQENSLEESLERQYSVGLPEAISSEKDYIDRTPEELYDLYVQNGWRIPFKRKYKDNMSISVADIESEIEKLAMRGYQVVCVVHDYLKRIRAINHIDDPTFDLGSAVNDFKILAKRYKIPVIDASQIQREAVRKASELAQKGQSFEGKFSGADMGNSIAAYENADGTYMLGNLKDPEGVHYMMICRLKQRYKAKKCPFSMVAIPFEGDTARLVCNFGKSESMGVRTTWGDRLEESAPAGARGNRFKRVNPEEA